MPQVQPPNTVPPVAPTSAVANVTPVEATITSTPDKIQDVVRQLLLTGTVAEAPNGKLSIAFDHV